MQIYNPYDWYWLADDGRLFASKRSVLIDPHDQDYVDWSSGENKPTPWPRDIDDNQTAAALQQVLAPYRIAVDLKAHAFMARDQKEHDGMPVSDISGMTEIRTDDYHQSLINRYHQAVALDDKFTVAWILPDRSTVMLNKSSINSLFNQATAYVTNTYNVYSQLVKDIDSGAIKTTDQIDQAFDGVPLRRGDPVIDIGWKK